MSTEENIDSCGFCTSKALYTCPQCNVKYCSSKCYKNSGHLKCSEKFYKGLVEDQLKGATASPESKEKMEEILRRLQQEEDAADYANDEALDSDDDEDLDERLKGIDLDDSDAVWSQLSESEQQEFLQLVRSGDTTELIPDWKAWWEHKVLVKEVEKDSEEVPIGMENCPTLVECPPLSQVTKTDPAPCIPFNILNVLSAYVWTVRIFNGDHQENCTDATEAVLVLSPVLSAAANYSSAEVAAGTAKLVAQNHSWLSESEEFSESVAKDLQKILEGPNASNRSLYVSAALSDVHSLLSTCKQTLSSKRKVTERPGVFKSTLGLKPLEIQKKLTTVDMVKKCLKKIEYFLSYVKEYPYKLVY